TKMKKPTCVGFSPLLPGIVMSRVGAGSAVNQTMINFKYFCKQ
ncbi:MAG: hypothetical protein ACI9FJ_000001, partial [Alteromonadaceae bacterium]